jgi:two-component system response regulator YcbB
MLSFGIVDDDAASIWMLQNIIEQSWLGEVIVTAENGCEGERAVLGANPDIVLMDLLMPEQDGIETINNLKLRGYNGKYVMISQIENKEMIGKAYQAGIEYYIQKPINLIEVRAVLSKVNEKWKTDKYLNEMKDSMAKLSNLNTDLGSSPRKMSVRETVQPILRDLGIVGEIGSRDMIEMMEYLIQQNKADMLPPLKELYEVAARAHQDHGKEGKAVEQRIRRTLMSALSNLASIGLTDYSNPKFEHYAPLYFDFQDIRLKMKEMDEKLKPEKGRVNIKKFLQVLYLEVLDKQRSQM